ncbi:MAG: hypothetical protein FIB00_11290 [Chloroflexi bacterium]|nr:hypothetical protein [Chloroflexota bacterium]
MSDAPSLARRLTILLPLIVLAGCVPVPVPAEKEGTRYDTLPQLQPGQITAEEIESRYGPPELRCDDDALWIYGWSVGHGAMTTVGIGGVWPIGRLYHAFHIVFVWLDSERRLVRIEAPEPIKSMSEHPAERICASDGTCVSARWYRNFSASDASWACKISIEPCQAYVLWPTSIVESNGRVLKCNWAGTEVLPPPESPGEARG